jgi:hypothetical protein
VKDPGGPKTSTWRTHRLCLEQVGDASHLLVIQDDAWPCDGFDEAVVSAVEERPEAVVCLFTPGASNALRAFEQARRRGDRWVPWRAGPYVPLVATVYPAEVARAIPAFADSRKIHVGRADDAVIATYVRAHRIPVYCTVPCLVQHRDELPSVMRMPHGRGATHRLAAWYREDGGAWSRQPAEAM